jgi:hypothetical protein
MPQTPFDSIESAHEYVDLLVHEAEEVRTGIQRDIAEAVSTEQTRRVDALRLVDYKLKQLTDHLSASRRLLNDLRMLRRLLIGGHEVDGSDTSARGARRSQPSV